MRAEIEQVWVSVEVARGNTVATYRGRIAAAELEAITSGNHFQQFLNLEDVHWVESVWHEQEQRFRTKVTAYGRDKQWKWNAGSLLLRVDTITSIALLKDCATLLRSREEFAD
jgi:hypothetical protein